MFSPANQKVLAAMYRLSETGTGIDVVTVTEGLRREGELDSVGGPAYLAKLLSEAGSPVSAEFYAKTIRDKAMVRRMIATASSIVSEGYSPALDPDEFMDSAEKRLFAVGEARLRGGVKPLSQSLNAAVAQVETFFERGGAVVGISTGYRQLDQMLLGLQDSDLLIVAARPSMGKTSFALNLAFNAARYEGKHVLFCSLEMAEEQLAKRVLCFEGRIESKRLFGGFLSRAELERVREVRNRLADTTLYIDDSPKMTVLEIRARARRMKSEGRLDLIMIDYLQMIDPAERRGNRNREQEIAEISRSLKGLAKELSIPVVALAQLSRAPETRPGKDKRPILSDLRESGSLEQDADVVMFLYRPEYYEKDQVKEEDRGIVEVLIAKQRNGPTGRVRLRFIEQYMLMANVEE
jgi:replicative DNA helicase